MASSQKTILSLSPFAILFLYISLLDKTVSIRLSNQISDPVVDSPDRPLKSAVFALGSFWRSEAAFGCINGVVRTTAGYSGGTKVNPEYRKSGDHAESVQVSLSFDLTMLFDLVYRLSMFG